MDVDLDEGRACAGFFEFAQREPLEHLQSRSTIAAGAMTALSRSESRSALWDERCVV
jgi:hypothetical protein